MANIRILQMSFINGHNVTGPRNFSQNVVEKIQHSCLPQLITYVSPYQQMLIPVANSVNSYDIKNSFLMTFLRLEKHTREIISIAIPSLISMLKQELLSTYRCTYFENRLISLSFA